jgi:hypothetical protein
MKLSLLRVNNSKTALGVPPEIGTSSVDWVQLSRLLSEDGDKSPVSEALLLNKKQGNG